jgi:hypothetical protein
LNAYDRVTHVTYCLLLALYSYVFTVPQVRAWFSTDRRCRETA